MPTEKKETKATTDRTVAIPMVAPSRLLEVLPPLYAVYSCLSVMVASGQQKSSSTDLSSFLSVVYAFSLRTGKLRSGTRDRPVTLNVARGAHGGESLAVTFRGVDDAFYRTVGRVVVRAFVEYLNEQVEIL